MMQRIKKGALVLLVCLAVLFTLGSTLNPLDKRMFTFHDDTQAARIVQMALNLKQGQIPPRLAPDMSFGLGFPVFNFYAPFSYWVATGFHLLGMPAVMALKFSFLLSVLFSFLSMYLLLRSFFRTFASLLGAVAYVSSLWFAVEIFVRGNLAECFFLAVFPLVLYLLVLNSRKYSNFILAAASLVISFALTTHNILSLISLPLFLFFILLLENKKRNLFALFLGGLLSSYFLIPALFESSLTYASQIAQKTDYRNHFLCAWQIWNAPAWEYGGSASGCLKDGMPFILGKIHLMLGVAGAGYFIYEMAKVKKKVKSAGVSVFFLLLGTGSLFLTLYQSSFVWDMFKPVLALFQFPWRFLVFVTVALAYFTALLFDRISSRFPKIPSLGLIAVFIIVLLFTSNKFFSKPWLMSYDEYNLAYLSKNYVSRTVAFNMAEYLPKTADYSFWRSFDTQVHPGKNLEIAVTDGSPIEVNDPSIYKVLSNRPFSKEVSVNRQTDIKINVHYFPFWEIYVNNKRIIPLKFDQLGRPVIHLSQPSIVHILYHETPVEKAGNIISVVSLLFLGLLIFYKPLWNKLKSILK